MGNNIIQARFEDHIRFLLLRYPKDLKRVAEEASKYIGAEVPMPIIEKILQRFKDKMGKDIKFWVSCNLAQEIIQGHLERQAKLEAMFMSWTGREEALESVCCSAPVTKHEPMQGAPYYRCVKCNETCGTRVVRALELENLKLRLIKDMRQESEHLMKFAKDMGFVANQPQEPLVKNQNYLIVNPPSEKARPIPIHSEIAQGAEQLSPMEREKLIHQLQGQLEEAVETEFVANEKECDESTEPQEN